jgi:acyl carrier protein
MKIIQSSFENEIFLLNHTFDRFFDKNVGFDSFSLDMVSILFSLKVTFFFNESTLVISKKNETTKFERNK